MQEKIRALLAKAEGTDNEHEREAFYEKAFALMIRYGISQDDLRPKEVKEEILRRTFTIPGKYAKQKVNFAWAFHREFGVYMVFDSKNRYAAARTTTITVYGKQSKIDQFITFVMDFWEYGERLYTAYPGSRGPGFLGSWWGHFSSVLRERYRAAIQTVEEEENVSLVPALRDDVELAKLSAGKVGTGQPIRHQYNPTGAAAGRSAGERATLAKGKISGGWKQLGS